MTLTLDPAIARAEGYRLTVAQEGVQTLRQLLQTQGATLPQMVIEDWPDFPARGVMLDISRDNVPTMDTLYDLIDMLASWKVNQFQLYMEHTFAYQQHRQVWQNASPMTAEETLALDAYCRQRNVDLVPNQNSFGHMHRSFSSSPNTSILSLLGVQFFRATTLGRTDNCLANLREAAEQGLNNGAISFLNTDWGDTHGYRRYLPVSYLGFAYGAAVSWALAANTDLDVPLALDTFAFGDNAAVMGKLAYDLGNAYPEAGELRHDGWGSFLYSLHVHSLANFRERAAILFHAGESQQNLFDDDLLRAKLHSTVEYIAEVISRIERLDADLMKREFAQMARMAQHGARSGLLQLSDPPLTRQSMRDELAAIEAGYPVLWLARSRPGGMVDSLRLIGESSLVYEDGACRNSQKV